MELMRIHGHGVGCVILAHFEGELRDDAVVEIIGHYLAYHHLSMELQHSITNFGRFTKVIRWS